MVRCPKYYPSRQCKAWRFIWDNPFPSWRNPTGLEKYAAFDGGWGFLMYGGFGWVEIDRSHNRRGRFRQKVLTPARKIALLKKNRFPMTVEQVRAAIRLFVHGGNPHEIVATKEFVRFCYDDRVIDIRPDGYAD